LALQLIGPVVQNGDVVHAPVGEQRPFADQHRLALDGPVNAAARHRVERIHGRHGEFAVPGPDRLAAWVYRIARNVVHDHHRKATSAAVPFADADPADAADDRQGRGHCGGCEWLGEMVRSLPDGYREAVELAEVEGLPQQEIADRLGLSLSGAKSRIQRGRVMLRDALEACCHFEFDSRGNMMDYEPKPDRKACRDCGE
jgi:RNA polymerase sigma-70 factor (ECF subfamily)